MSFFYAVSDVEVIECLHAEPVKVGGKGTSSRIEMDTNSKDGFVERYTEEEASEFSPQKNMKVGHNFAKAGISNRHRDETFGRKLMRQLFKGVVVEERKLTGYRRL